MHKLCLNTQGGGYTNDLYLKALVVQILIFMKVYFNGQFLDDASSLSVAGELGFLRGYGIFDFFGIRGGVPLFIDDYLNRFFNSAEKVGMTIPVSKKQLEADIFQLIRTNDIRKAYFKMVLTGGYSEDGFNSSETNLYIFPQPIKEHPEERYTQGVKIITDAYKREMPEVKTTNYMNAVMKASEMKNAGASEILYHDNGLIRECSRSNIFLVKGKTVITPSTGILEGISRKQILKVIKLDYEIEERNVTVEELKEADEIFITSTTKLLFPVVEIDGWKVLDGEVGKVSLDILDRMKANVATYIQAHS